MNLNGIRIVTSARASGDKSVRVVYRSNKGCLHPHFLPCDWIPQYSAAPGNAWLREGPLQMAICRRDRWSADLHAPREETCHRPMNLRDFLVQ